MLSEVKKLDERKKKVLQAIVEEYIQTAEPVSSNAIMNLEGLECSSATIRNEMADLEKSGYIEKTHTSSGRIPSALGYRLYVNELIKDDNISLEEIKYIQSKLSIPFSPKRSEKCTSVKLKMTQKIPNHRSDHAFWRILCNYTF